MVHGHLIGTVVSAKMMKSVVVRIPYFHFLRRVEKRIVRHSKKMAHDDLGCKEGDLVQLAPCQKRSKRKSHIVTEILRRAPTW
mmetsp:Transcript_10173/g.26403  ORF Transcript_10173/g.26403 Transcript_10173/m.26403 type:complete len:83 (-) Transcript_10173:584-832(-)